MQQADVMAITHLPAFAKGNGIDYSRRVLLSGMAAAPLAAIPDAQAAESGFNPYSADVEFWQAYEEWKRADALLEAEENEDLWPPLVAQESEAVTKMLLTPITTATAYYAKFHAASVGLSTRLAGRPDISFADVLLWDAERMSKRELFA